MCVRRLSCRTERECQLGTFGWSGGSSPELRSVRNSAPKVPAQPDHRVDSARLPGRASCAECCFVARLGAPLLRREEKRVQIERDTVLLEGTE